MGSDGFHIFFTSFLQNFNPRSPHGERHAVWRRSTRSAEFQSTLPAWGATDWLYWCRNSARISIHAPRMGSDVLLAVYLVIASNFNPRSPHGERHHPIDCWKIPDGISIHAPRMGSDSTAKAYSNDRIKWSTLREPHFFYSKNACFSPIVSMCATTSRTKKSENQSFIRIISRLGPYVFHLRLVSIPQIIEPYAVRLLVHQHFQCGTK